MQSDAYAPHLHNCSCCGHTLTLDNIQGAMADLGWDRDDPDLDKVTLCCPGYTDEEGCPGNDPTAPAYWMVR